MDKTWYYDAFISYRHTELDSFVAKNLHKQLESFKLPKNVVHKLQEKEQENGIGKKTRITRVFRDQEELPLVSNLADPIMEALEKSEYLIVICSPRLKESIWCRKEIETFISMHDREHVLAVLIEGEPEDSFPEELLYREIEETINDGSVIKKKVPVEPLAADVRGTTQKEIRKKIKAEVLRLAAPMFQCGYDDLKQRHREQKMRKMITASLAGSAVCLLFGLVSTTMALQIRRQNVQIMAQSEEIALQSEEIEKQYQEAMRSNCISQAQTSLSLLEEGDRIEAIQTALSVYPGGENKDVPYTAQTAYALSKSLHLYENGTRILPDRILEADTTISFMKTSPVGSRMLAVDDSCKLYVWDGESGICMDSFLLDDWFDIDEDKTVFIDENRFLYPTKGGIALYDLENHAISYTVECGHYDKVVYSKENDMILVQGFGGIYLIKGSSGAELLYEKWEAGYEEAVKESIWNEDGSMFAVSYMTVEEIKKTDRLVLYDSQTGEALHRYELQDGRMESMKFAEDVLYLLVNQTMAEDGSIWDRQLGGTLYACDLTKDNAFLWTYESDSQWVYDVSISSKDDSNYMLCTSYDNAVVLDRRDGSYIDSFFFGSEIVQLGNYRGKDTFLVFTRDGVMHYVNLEIMTDLVGNAFGNCTSANVKMFELGDDYYATLPYQDKKITLYRTAIGPNFETLCESEYDYYDAVLSGDGIYLAVSSYWGGCMTYVEMIATDTGEVLWHYDADNYLEGMSFYPEKGALTVVTSDGICLLDMETGQEMAFYDMSDLWVDYLSTDATGRYIFLIDNDTLYGCDLADGSIVYEIGEESLFAGNDDYSAVAVSPYRKYYAVASKVTDSLQIYYLDDLQERKNDCLDEVENINAAYVDYLFFNHRNSEKAVCVKEGEESVGEGLVLYVVYKNGDITAYPIDSSAPEFDVAAAEQYQDMEDEMMRFIRLEGTDYNILVGRYDAALICNAWAADKEGTGEEGNGQKAVDWEREDDGKMTAYMNGFLAADAEKGCIYLTDRHCIYRVPIYDAAALREEAEIQLGIN